LGPKLPVVLVVLVVAEIVADLVGPVSAVVAAAVVVPSAPEAAASWTSSTAGESFPLPKRILSVDHAAGTW